LRILKLQRGVQISDNAKPLLGHRALVSLVRRACPISGWLASFIWKWDKPKGVLCLRI